jgi:hypothetical protein
VTRIGTAGIGADATTDQLYNALVTNCARLLKNRSGKSKIIYTSNLQAINPLGA